jgi:hypothetical protein
VLRNIHGCLILRAIDVIAFALVLVAVLLYPVCCRLLFVLVGVVMRALLPMRDDTKDEDRGVGVVKHGWLRCLGRFYLFVLILLPLQMQ